MRKRACKAMSLSFFDPAFDSDSMERMASARWACQSASESGVPPGEATAMPAVGTTLAGASLRVAANRSAIDGGSGAIGLDCADFPVPVVAAVELASSPPLGGGSGKKAGRSSKFAAPSRRGLELSANRLDRAGRCRLGLKTVFPPCLAPAGEICFLVPRRRSNTRILSRYVCSRAFLLLSFRLALGFASPIGGCGLEGLQFHWPKTGVRFLQIGHQLVASRRIDGSNLLKLAHHLLQGFGVGLAAGSLGGR